MTSPHNPDTTMPATAEETVILGERGREIAEGWQPIGTYPKDGTYFEVLYENGTTEAEVYWTDTRYCMLGVPQGSRGPGLVSTEAGNLPIDIEDGITHWRPATPSDPIKSRRSKALDELGALDGELLP